METSRHRHIDRYGYRCEVEIASDDIVVFDSTPALCFDFREHGVKISRSEHYDYLLCYEINEGKLLLRRIETRLPRLHGRSEIFGVKAETEQNGTRSVFFFDGIPVDYTGTLRVGRTFDARCWPRDEKAVPVPFSPEVYRENGFIRFEKGTVAEKTLTSEER